RGEPVEENRQQTANEHNGGGLVGKGEANTRHRHKQRQNDDRTLALHTFRREHPKQRTKRAHEGDKKAILERLVQVSALLQKEGGSPIREPVDSDCLQKVEKHQHQGATAVSRLPKFAQRHSFRTPYIYWRGSRKGCASL